MLQLLASHLNHLLDEDSYFVAVFLKYLLTRSNLHLIKAVKALSQRGHQLINLSYEAHLNELTDVNFIRDSLGAECKSAHFFA